VRVASRSTFSDFPFGARRIARSSAPVPQERPYDLGQDDRLPSEPAPALRARTFEARRLPPTEVSANASLADLQGTPSPVTAYAPMRQDGSQALTTGRGLY
jgi:hypothetical protein